MQQSKYGMAVNLELFCKFHNIIVYLRIFLSLIKMMQFHYMLLYWIILLENASRRVSKGTWKMWRWAWWLKGTTKCYQIYFGNKWAHVVVQVPCKCSIPGVDKADWLRLIFTCLQANIHAKPFDFMCFWSIKFGM